MENKLKHQPNKNKIGVKDFIIGLPFLCNPALIVQFLYQGLIRETYINLINNGNEREEVLASLEHIPDGLEREVGGFINNAVEIMGNKKRRSMDTKISAKPHLHIAAAIKTAENVFTRTK